MIFINPKHLSISLIALICFVFMQSAAFAQPGTKMPEGKPGVDFNLLDSKGKKEGLWVQQWKSTGNLLYRGQFKAGVPEGTWERYYADGKLMAITRHIQDTTVVDVTFFHPDGKTQMSEGRYLKKKKAGQWKIWDESGILRSDENYQDSLLDGISKYYYDNGKLIKTETYKKGVKDGAFEEYHKNGKKRMQGTYAADAYNGPFKAWFENGLLEREGEYLKGAEHGAWYFYNETGSPKMSVHYSKGKIIRKVYINGTFKEFWPDDIPMSEYTYEDGKKNGPFTEWYDVGVYAEEPVTDKEHIAMGIVKRQVLKGTQVKVQGDYLDDKLEGEVIYYSEKGKVEKVELWKDGVLVSQK